MAFLRGTPGSSRRLVQDQTELFIREVTPPLVLAGGERLQVTIGADTHQLVRLLDTRTDKHRMPAVGPGTCALNALSRAGRRPTYGVYGVYGVSYRAITNRARWEYSSMLALN